MRRWPMMGGAVLALGTMVAVTPVCFARVLDGETIKALRREQQRVAALAKARREAPPAPEVFRAKLLEPVVRGNLADLERNAKLVETYRGRAEDATRNRQEETAKKYVEAAKLFHQLGGVNRKILNAIQAHDNAALLAAYEELVPIEDRIAALTGKQVPRDWFTPAELAIPLPAEDNDDRAVPKGADAGTGRGATSGVCRGWGQPLSGLRCHRE
ncbi:MAG: hypothetical protein BWX70_01606 [Verrucomicrobia bacterium ADurb.Bin070]|nr:MAG: hypothetical protein BWX70_01606 [Verrucomicrobia bacterium ADurb.Bin070]